MRHLQLQTIIGAAAGLLLLATGASGAAAPAAVVSPETPAKKLAASPPLEFVLVPGGQFAMGSDQGDPDEKPVHQVKLKNFQMSKTEVTVGQFRKFVEDTTFVTQAETLGFTTGLDKEGVWGRKDGWSWKHPGYEQADDSPVTCVSWTDAQKFCQWAGGRLPTEAEWEYAAGNGARHTRYSWGNDPPTGKKGGNVSDETGKKTFPTWTIFEGYDDGYLFPAPAARFEPNDFGLYDMTGNVWEYCSDLYDEKYYENSPAENPSGAKESKYHVLRGGGWNTGPAEMRITNRVRISGMWEANIAGFRCARDAP